MSHVQDAVTRGATVVCGGKAPGGAAFSKGHWMEPTVLAGLNAARQVESGVAVVLVKRRR